MKSIGNFSITDISYTETRRGIAYIGNIIKDNEVIGTIEHRGDGGCVNVLVFPAHRDELKRVGIEYFNSIGFKTENVDDHRFEQTIVEHLLCLAETGEVDEETLKLEWLA